MVWETGAHSMLFVGEGNGTLLQYSCLENPMDGGAWNVAVHGVAEGRTRLSDFTFMHWRRKWQPTRVLAWRISGTGEPGGLPSMGSHRVGHDWSDLAVAVCCLGWFKCPPLHRKDHMVSKGPPQTSGSRACIAISKAKYDSVFAEGLLSQLLSLNSFKLEHGHYLSVSLQRQVTSLQLFIIFFFKSSQKNHSKLKGKQF